MRNLKNNLRYTFRKLLRIFHIEGWWEYHRERALGDVATYVVNFIYQRILRINAETPWSVHYTSIVRNPTRIYVEPSAKRCFATSPGCYFQGANGIYIGTETLFGPGVRILSGNHDPLNLRGPLLASEPIRIGKRCWLGANVIILPGVQLGDDVIIGAGSVVTKSFSSGSVLVGNPARILRTR